MKGIKILFGRRVKELRVKRNMTQAYLAEMVNVDDKHISCIENGKNFPSPDVIERIAKAFNIEAKDLFEYHHLQDDPDLKKGIADMVETLTQNELRLAFQYIRTFLIK